MTTNFLIKSDSLGKTKSLSNDTIFIDIHNNSHLDSLRPSVEGLNDHLHGIEKNKGTLISHDVVFTFIASLLTFVIGFAVRNYYNQRLENRKRKKLSKLYIYYIKSLESRLDKLIIGYRDLCSTFSISNVLVSIPPKVPSDDIERIKAIPFQDIYEYFDYNENLSTPNSRIDYSEEIISTAEEYHSIFREEDLVNRAKLTDLTNSGLSLFYNFNKDYQESWDEFEGSAELRIMSNDIIYLFYENVAGGKSLPPYYRRVRLIVNHIVDYGLHHKISGVEELVKSLRDFSHHYNAMRQNIVRFKLQYRDFGKKLQRSKEIISNSWLELEEILQRD